MKEEMRGVIRAGKNVWRDEGEGEPDLRWERASVKARDFSKDGLDGRSFSWNSNHCDSKYISDRDPDSHRRGGEGGERFAAGSGQAVSGVQCIGGAVQCDQPAGGAARRRACVETRAVAGG